MVFQASIDHLGQEGAPFLAAFSAKTSHDSPIIAASDSKGWSLYVKSRIQIYSSFARLRCCQIWLAEPLGLSGLGIQHQFLSGVRGQQSAGESQP